MSKPSFDNFSMSCRRVLRMVCICFHSLKPILLWPLENNMVACYQESHFFACSPVDRFCNVDFDGATMWL